MRRSHIATAAPRPTRGKMRLRRPTDDARCGWGLCASRCTISWAYGCSERQWRNGASAACSACDAFFELTKRAGRIARRLRCGSAAATRSLHGHDNAHRKPAARCTHTRRPPAPWRCWTAAAVWSGPRAAESGFVFPFTEAQRSGKTGAAIPRGESGLCDPRRSTRPPAHLCAWHVSPTRIPTRHGSERSEGMSRDGFPDRGSRPRTASAAAAPFRAAHNRRLVATPAPAPAQKDFAPLAKHAYDPPRLEPYTLPALRGRPCGTVSRPA